MDTDLQHWFGLVVWYGEGPGVEQLEERVEELEQREEGWRRANALAEDLREQLAARWAVLWIQIHCTVFGFGS